MDEDLKKISIKLHKDATKNAISSCIIILEKTNNVKDAIYQLKSLRSAVDTLPDQHYKVK